MPSGARLAAALLMALAMLGCLYVAALHETGIGEARNRLLPLAGATGAFFGWTMLGSRLGAGFTRAIARAIATIVISGFWFFAILAGRSIWLSLEAGLFRGKPLQAIEALVERFMALAGYALSAEVLVAALVGAFVAGAIGEYGKMIWN